MTLQIFDTFYFPFYFRNNYLNDDKPEQIGLHPVVLFQVVFDEYVLLPISTAGQLANRFTIQIPQRNGIYRRAGMQKHPSFVLADQENYIRIDDLVSAVGANPPNTIGNLADSSLRIQITDAYEAASKSGELFAWWWGDEA